MKNRMFGDDEPAMADYPSPRTTIVGGRPPEAGAKLPPVPTGLQRLLRLASVDEGFEAELLGRRAGMAEAAGVELVASERAILDAASAEQLRSMIACLPAPATDRRTFLKEAAVGALAVLGGAALQGCADAAAAGTRADAGARRPERPEMHTKGGHKPDEPIERPLHKEMETEGGIAPKPVPDAGVERPEKPQPTRGIRHDVPPPKPEEGK